MASKHTPADRQLIDNLSMGVVTAFRSSIYKSTYIASNAHLFINNDWIDADQLRQFLLRADDPDPSSSPRDLPPTRVKLEEESSATRISTEEHPRASLDVSTGKTRTLKEGNREILKILSDSDTVSDSEDDVMTDFNNETTRENSTLIPTRGPETLGLGTQKSQLHSSQDNHPSSAVALVSHAKEVMSASVDPQLLKRQTRREEGTMEHKAAEFAQVVRDQKCSAIDTNGVKCKGMPFLKSKNQASLLLIPDGWRPDFKTKYRTWTIPDDVDEVLFHKAFHSQPLATDSSKDTPLCSTIVHPHNRLKQHNCRYAHINLGKQVTSRIINRSCDAARTIYVPLDPSIRKALTIHNNNIAHNHPMPTLTKVLYELKVSHRECIKAAGCVGATVAKVDNAPSTQLILDGKRPGEFAAALQSNRVKRKLVREAKMEAYPAGLDAAGAFHLFFEDLKKPVDERYIQRLVTMPDGGLMILTIAAFMKLDATLKTDALLRAIQRHMKDHPELADDPRLVPLFAHRSSPKNGPKMSAVKAAEEEVEVTKPQPAATGANRTLLTQNARTEGDPAPRDVVATPEPEIKGETVDNNQRMKGIVHVNFYDELDHKKTLRQVIVDDFPVQLSTTANGGKKYSALLSQLIPAAIQNDSPI
ncbi:hypothetical protein DFH09DRAFT_1369014 [Mycena vulgaris]|nr:hypothetical protein DFH09DRAFT_1369014 [Mycena vulgaris]